jgi:DNA repair protein REV1
MNNMEKARPMPTSAKRSLGRSAAKTTLLLQHEFTDEGGEEYGGTGFGDFRTYMAAKQTKLQNQAQASLLDAKADASSDGRGSSSSNNNNSYNTAGSQVFRGCVIYINGYTGATHSSEMLQRLIIANGGVHVNHMWGGRTTVTHIVATTLTNRKREMFQDYRVVTPEWVLACVEQGKLLDWIEYHTVPGMDPGQRTLTMPKNPMTAVTPNLRTSDLNEKSSLQKYQQKAVKEAKAETDTPAKDDLNNNDDSFKSVPPITDPAFITYFYQHSRLHHLSHWKAELRRRYLPPASVVAQLLAATAPSSSTERPPILFHVDYDSFFVAASLLSRPELRDRPVVVVSGSAQSSDVASANYVARRQYGIRNGMWLASARKCCPTLVVLPLEFVVYEQKSAALFNVLNALGADLVYPVSVDEAVVDVSSVIYAQAEQRGVSLEEAVAALAATVRNRVREAAGIEVSVGAGTNMLLARLALAQAKPAGQHFLSALVTAADEEGENTINKNPGAVTSGSFSSVDDTLTLRDLPGVGRSIVQRLAAMGITSLRQLRAPRALARLTNTFGPNHGVRLHELGRGIDRTRLVDCCVSDRKSVGAEISWGVRARNRAEVDAFLGNLLQEVCRRLNDEDDDGTSEKKPGKGAASSSSSSSSCSATTITAARGVTLKVYRALPDADPTRAKRLGHGQCDIYSRSRTLGAATRDAAVLFRVLRTLMDGMDCPAERLRGVGIQLTKLERSAAGASGGTGAGGNRGLLRFVTSAASPKKSTAAMDIAEKAMASAVNVGDALQANRIATIDTTTATPRGNNCSVDNKVIKDAHEVLRNDNDNYIGPASDRDVTSNSLVSHDIDASEIDWDVYQTLPASLRRVIRAEYNLPVATASQLIREDAEVESEAKAVEIAGSKAVINPGWIRQTDTAFDQGSLATRLPEEAALLREEAELEVQAEQLEIERQIREQQQQQLDKKKRISAPLVPPPTKRARLTRRVRVYQNTLTQQFPSGVDPSSRRDGPHLEDTRKMIDASYNYFQHPSILDVDVLQELPHAVLAELQRDLKLRGVVSTSSSHARKGIGIHNNNVINAGKARDSNPQAGARLRSRLPPAPARESPLLDARYSLAEAGPLVVQWLTFAAEAGGGPHEADVRVVTDYACRLAANPRYWRDAVRLVRNIERELHLHAYSAWGPVVTSLKDTVRTAFEGQGVPVAL